MFRYGYNSQFRNEFYKCRNQRYILDKFCSGKIRTYLTRGQENVSNWRWILKGDELPNVKTAFWAKGMKTNKDTVFS